jgi:phosphoheptose isomerase
MQPQNQNSDQTAKIAAAIKLLITSYDAGGSLLICGNGGSAADCEHIVGELMKGFCLPRSLSAHDRDRLTAICGDDAARLGEKPSIWIASPVTCQPFIPDYRDCQ